MKKFTIAIIAILSLSACDKLPWSHSPRNAFVKMCEEDPRAKAQGFDCSCQADMLQAILKEDEMTKLMDFINAEKTDKDKAVSMSKDPSYGPIFQKIGSIGYALHDKCSKPGAEPAPATQPVPQQTAPAPAAQSAPAQPATPEPATPAPRTHKKK